MDLSYAAAYKLGYINNGSVEVEVESIAVDANAPVATATALVSEPLTIEPLAPAMLVAQDSATAGKVYLQLGAFRSSQGAESFLAKLRADYGDLGKPLGLFQKQDLTRVQLGPYRNKNEARADAERLKARLGFKPFVSMH
jgi:rare lipoprotein A